MDWAIFKLTFTVLIHWAVGGFVILLLLGFCVVMFQLLFPVSLFFILIFIVPSLYMGFIANRNKPLKRYF